MKILLVEDEELYADQVEMLINKMGYELVGIADNSNAALSYLQDAKPDLILMDVHIRGDHDGVELSGLIKEQYDIPIIFITSMKDDLTFKRANRVGASNFIIKPFDQIQLQRAIELAIADVQNNEATDEPFVVDKEYVFIKSRNNLDKVLISDIYFLESDSNYTIVYTETKKYLVRKPLNKVAELLSKNDFISTHRTYMVNKNRVQSIDLSESTISILDRSIPISKRNKAKVLKALGAILE